MPLSPTPVSISGSTLLGLFSPQGAHLLVFAWTLGSNGWETFVGGSVAFRALPRLHFRALRGKIFKYYFSLNAVASTYLLASHLLLNPLTSSILTLSSPPSFNAFLLGAHAATYWLNWLVVGKKVSALMHERADQEVVEGKGYNEEGISEKMKDLNERFIQAHVVSSLLNMAALGLITVHGLWIAEYGV